MVAQSTLGRWGAASASCCGRGGVRLGGGAPGPGAASLTQRAPWARASSGRYSGQSCSVRSSYNPCPVPRVGVTAACYRVVARVVIVRICSRQPLAWCRSRCFRVTELRIASSGRGAISHLSELPELAELPGPGPSGKLGREWEQIDNCLLLTISSRPPQHCTRPRANWFLLLFRIRPFFSSSLWPYLHVTKQQRSRGSVVTLIISTFQLKRVECGGSAL